MNELNTMKINSNIILEKKNKPRINKTISTNKKDFNQILNRIQKNNGLKFSKHAIQRLDNRDIQLSDVQISKINNAVNKAENKGVKEALILMGDTAFIASVKNKTIITTVTSAQLKDNVFTNIDGAVII